MPDLLVVFAKRWKFILGLTIVASVMALIISVISPKKYLATATALPANSVTADRARLFNDNIEGLYSDFGAPDELDRIEGTAALDTIFIATSMELNLVSHYSKGTADGALFKAAMELKDNTKTNRSGYGELKIRVWDENRNMAALMANTLLLKLKDLHQRLQNENNKMVLAKTTEDYQRKQDQFRQVSDSVSKSSGTNAELLLAKKTSLISQLQQYEKMIDQYQLAVNANPQVLLTVENARAPLWPDKPKTLPAVLISAFAAFACSFLIALFVESRNAIK